MNRGVLLALVGLLAVGCDSNKLAGGALDLSLNFNDLSAVPDLASPPNTGDIFIDSSTTSFISADFLRATDFQVPVNPCTKETNGDCVTSTCSLSPPDMAGYHSPDLSGFMAATAGTLSITGLQGGTVTLTPNANGVYQASSNSAYLSGGETIGVSATGNSVPGNVPSFSGMLTAPAPAVITMPTLPGNNGALMVTRANDQTFTWTGGDTGKLTITFTQTTADSFKTAVCTFAGSAHQGTVQHAALSGFAGSSAFISATMGNANTGNLITVGDWGISMSATADATQGGHPFSAAVTFQ